MKLMEKETARTLRKEGYSINQIVETLNFSKASVSVWVRDIMLTKEQKNRLSRRGRSVESIERRRNNRLANEHKKRRYVMDLAKKDFVKISQAELKIIGIILYLGEGAKKTKGTVSLSNSDPIVIQIMIKFLEEVCHVPQDKLRGHIHTFTHADIEKTEEYWSDITGIPRKQFYKTYAKSSSASLHKRNTLPFGTFALSVCDTRLLLTIFGWIEKIKELVIGNKS